MKKGLDIQTCMNSAFCRALGLVIDGFHITDDQFKQRLKEENISRIDFFAFPSQCKGVLVIEPLIANGRTYWVEDEIELRLKEMKANR